MVYSWNRHYSGIVLRKVGILTKSPVRVFTLPGEVRRFNSASEIVHAQS